MRLALPPDSVTLPPPSMTSLRVLLRTFAVWVRVIVFGLDPQLKVTTPPAVTAETNAAEVQLAGVPSPTTWSGALTSSSPIPAGTVAVPFGLPGAKLLGAGDEGDGDVGDGDVGDGDGGLALARKTRST